MHGIISVDEGLEREPREREALETERKREGKREIFAGSVEVFGLNVVPAILQSACF